MALDDFFRRPSDLWDLVLFRARRPLQSPELNELQAIFARQLGALGDTLYRDGDVISGCDVRLDADTGAAEIGAGRLYIRGGVRQVAAAAMTVPVLGAVAIGVYLTETEITELEDPDLLNPVPGAETYHAPGAARLQVTLAWGWQTGGETDGQTGEFYRVYGVTNGVLDNVAPPPQLDGVQLALARYDRAQTGGTYVSAGLAVHALEIAAGQQVYSLAEGRAHVDGFEVEKPTATRLAYPDDPDLLLIETEPHVFLAGGDGRMRIDVVNGPMAEIVEVKITAQRVDVTITHGGYSGAIDPLPDVSVLQLINVKQGATTYVIGTDCKRTGNAVDWSLAGAEPAPGTTYTVTYQYLTDGTVTDADDEGFFVAGAVEGTVVNVDYRHKLRRFDRLVMDRDGIISRVRGIADLYGPSVPSVPAGALSLATLEQTWWGLPRVVPDAPRIMHVGEVMSLSTRVDKLFDLVALERLRWDVTAREPSAAKGVFVDPFLDNDQRDVGLAQTAAIVAGELTLPIAPIFTDALAAGGPQLLSYVLEPAIIQDLATGGMKVNPYMAFTPIPPTVTIIPAVDRWTEHNEVWDGDSTRFIRTGHFVEGISRAVSSEVVESSIETVGRSEVAAQFLRQIPVTVRIEHLGAGEIVDRIAFDGVQVATNLTANGEGVIEHAFTIPANIPAGSKRIDVEPRASGKGAAVFTGQGTITTEVRRRSQTIAEYHVDPVAQTFTLDTGRHIGGVDLLFRAKGASQVLVQIREVQLGLPSRVVLAEARKKPADIRTDGQPTRFEWQPVWLEAGADYAIVVLCDDPDAEVAIAELAKFDATRQRWVTAQPYQVGVLLSSSNATTWTAHQSADLWFRLLGCRFTATSRQVTLGTLSAAQVSDLVALFNAERPSSETRIILRLTAPDGATYALSDGQPMNLPTRLDGDLVVQAVLEGTDLRSPVLHPGVQAIFGVLSDAATYIGRAFPCGTASKIRIVYEAFTPGTSTVAAAVQASDASWVDVALTASAPVGDGWEECTHVLNAHTATETRLKLTLSGSPLNRPIVRRLRVVVT